jgi:hypothetical protein
LFEANHFDCAPSCATRKEVSMACSTLVFALSSRNARLRGFSLELGGVAAANTVLCETPSSLGKLVLLLWQWIQR